MKENKNPIDREGEGPGREKSVDSITPLGRSHQGGAEGGVEKLTMISLVLRFQLPEM